MARTFRLSSALESEGFPLRDLPLTPDDCSPTAVDLVSPEAQLRIYWKR
jgi:hypothetical protein